jgi:hypothetical protein
VLQGECILVFLPGIDPIADVQLELEHFAKVDDTPLQVMPCPPEFSPLFICFVVFLHAVLC